jgi:hypothetical protein
LTTTIGLQAQRQRLLGHEAGLRHRAFDRVDQQHHAVDHAEHALDLAAEVGVAGVSTMLMWYSRSRWRCSSPEW